MTDTWLTLQLARDAWDSGRLRESWQLMDRVEVDFEYGGWTSRISHTRFRFVTRDWLAWREQSWASLMEARRERRGTGTALVDPAAGCFTVDRHAFYDRVSFGDSVITGVDVERGVVTIGSDPSRIFVNPDSYRRLVPPAPPVARPVRVVGSRRPPPSEFGYLSRWSRARRGALVSGLIGRMYEAVGIQRSAP